MSALEKEDQKFLDAQIRSLHRILQPYIKQIEDALKGIDNGFLTDSEIQARINQVRRAYSDMLSTLTIYTNTVMPFAYQKSAAAIREYLKGLSRVDFKQDNKAINLLIKDMNHSFEVALSNGEKAVTTYIRFSKLGTVTESEISQAVASGLIDYGQGKAAKAMLQDLIQSRGTPIYDLDSYKKFVTKFGKRKGVDIDPEDFLKDSIRTEYGLKLKDSKFLQIIDKNGKVMNFRTETYTELVSRTRIGEAQVQGAIDEAGNFGNSEFLVTSHNTTTPICKQFEGKIFTTDPSKKMFPMLTRANTPLYHVNCQHRLLPIRLTSKELSNLKAVR